MTSGTESSSMANTPATNTFNSFRQDEAGQISCHRKTSLKLKRLSTDLSVEASLWTQQDATGRLLSFELQRTDGAGKRLLRTGELDYERGVILLNDATGIRSGARQIRLGGTVYSPIISSWGLDLVDQYERRQSRQVFFPEAGGIAKVVFEFRSDGLLKVGRQRVLTSRFSFYPETDTEKRTLVWSENGVMLRQEKLVFGGTLAIIKSTPEEALAGSNSALDLDARALIPVSGLSGFKTKDDRLVVELSVDRGTLPIVPASDTQIVKQIDASTVQLILTQPQYPTIQSVIGPKPATIEDSSFFPLRDPTILNLASRGAGAERIRFESAGTLNDSLQRTCDRGHFQLRCIPLIMWRDGCEVTVRNMPLCYVR